jgi:hypothetical protein
VSDSEPYGLRSLRRAASNGYAVSPYPCTICALMSAFRTPFTIGSATA